MRLSSIILLFIILFIHAPARAQQPNRNELEKRRQAIMESLKETQAQLEATKNDKKATMSQLNALQAKLNTREKLIHNINQEMKNLDNDIQNSSSEVQQLRKTLSLQQQRYAQSVRYAYSNRSAYNGLAFVFSAEEFNVAMRRLKYMRKYREYRKKQVDEIKLTQKRLEQKINVLSTVKNQKGTLLTAEEQQKLELQEERNETSKIVQELKGRENDLVKDLENKRSISKRLDKAISDAIRKEIEIARKKAEEEERKRKIAEEAARRAAEVAAAQNKNVYGSGDSRVILMGPEKDEPSSGSNKPGTGKPANSNTAANTNKNTSNQPPVTGTKPYSPIANTVKPDAPANNTTRKPTYTPTSTPEVTELSKEFESNRGKLPWPVTSGVVVDQFGKHKHAIATKVEIENNGIDIQTGQGAKARAVFEGTVTNVISMPGLGQTVLINHGKYFTVYSGLTNVQVKKDDRVNTKQTIGTVMNNEDGVAVMNFQVWNGASKMNPSLWIAPM